MSLLPPGSSFTGSGVSEGQLKAAINALVDDYLAGLFGYDGERAARHNAIIGGDFSTNPWQRGTSFAAAVSGIYTADRWQYFKVGSSVHTLSRSTDVPTVAQAGRLFTHSLLIDCTTADASIAAGDFCCLSQQIEGFNFIPLAQRAVTLSFWVKATKAGFYSATIGNSGNDRQWVAEYEVLSSDTWERKVLTFTSSPSAGTWNYTNGAGLKVTFWLAAGSDFHATPGSWQTVSTNLKASANQVNACDSTSNDFRLCGVQLEVGTVATIMQPVSLTEELLRCQRYARFFSVLNCTGTNPGTSGYICPSGVLYPEMRDTPTLTTNIRGTSALSYRSGAGVITFSTASGTMANWETFSNIVFSGLSSAIVVGECYVFSNVLLTAEL